MAFNEFEYYNVMDQHPLTGVRQTNFKAKISDKKYLDKFFIKTDDCDFVTNVTRGKIYDIIEVECYGDCVDFIFIDDIGNKRRLGDFFFTATE